ncbi:emp24p/erv25p- protein [Entomophthora muscae]|uniref:Emp24p/erv25p- protein n=1 Tax=Entomophthora muscae TaxID=34485 RepID=A0ACC2T336_9FUNG|nr:emp24p/erv25p- protein [Entomophthora muscae]
MLRLQFKEAFALLFLFSASFTQAFYFYLEGGDPKCFLEDLPNETVVAAKYRVEKFDENTQSYVSDSLFQVSLAVNKDDEPQPLVSQKLGTDGNLVSPATVGAIITSALPTQVQEAGFTTRKLESIWISL